jgi:hypothetical protein
MSTGIQDLDEARAVREESERLVRESADMNRADTFLYLTAELGYGPVAAEQAIQEADAVKWHHIARVPMVRRALVLVADVPGAMGWPATGRYHVDLAQS